MKACSGAGRGDRSSRSKRGGRRRGLAPVRYGTPRLRPNAGDRYLLAGLSSFNPQPSGEDQPVPASPSALRHPPAALCRRRPLIAASAEYGCAGGLLARPPQVNRDSELQLTILRTNGTRPFGGGICIESAA